MEYSPWSSPGQNTGAGSLSLLQGIFLTQESNPGLPHCRQVLYQLSQREAQNTTEGCLLTHGLISSPAQTYKADFLFCSWRRWSMGMFIVSFKVMGTLMRRWRLVLTASQLCYIYESCCLLGGIASVESFDPKWCVRFELTLWLTQQAHPVEVSRGAWEERFVLKWRWR